MDIFGRFSKGKVLAVGLASLVFVVGLVTVLQKVGSVVPAALQGLTPKQAMGESKVTTINNANFDYLVPGKDLGWEFLDDQTAYDAGKGVVKYQLTLNPDKVNVTVSQQELPAELKPRDSKNFKAFIGNSKPTRSQVAGQGTVYYLPALVNGEPAPNGSDTIIYATDDRLLFGRAGRVVDFDTWALLLATMTKKSPK